MPANAPGKLSEPAGTGWWLICHLEAFEQDPRVLANCHLPAARASVSPGAATGLVTACSHRLPWQVPSPQSVFLGAGTPLGLVRAWGLTLPRGDRLVT